MRHVAALLSLHAAVALFGFAGLFGKWLALSPVVIVLGRTAIAAMALLVVRRWRRAGVPFDPRLAANGIVLAVHWLSFFAAIQVSGVIVALLGYAGFPLFTLLFERVFSGGFSGQATDIEIQAREGLRLKSRLDEILARHTRQPLGRIEKDTDRDYFMGPDEAKEYGLIDEVIVHWKGAEKKP